MNAVRITLPRWVEREITLGETFRSPEARMRLAIRLSELNVQHKTGGPFGAAVFEKKSGKLVSVGVNRVVPCRCSLAHAEATALMFAQQAIGSFDLGGKELPLMELVTSAQPCVQCFGNIWWSGIDSVVIGARARDVESLTGFDEGPLPRNWARKLEKREGLKPVAVVRDFMRREACHALKRYKATGGKIYNAGST